MIFKSLFRPFVYLLRSAIHFIKNKLQAVSYRWTKSAWIRQQKSLGSQIANDVDFTGLLPLPQYLSSGKNVLLQKHTTIWISPYAHAPHIEIHDGVFIGQNVMIVAHESIIIGKNSLIGHYSHITSCNHSYHRRDIPIREQGFVGEPVIVGEDVWVGTYSVILPGVVIGNGSIVAAGSIVTHNIPEYEVWGGTPARFIKKRN
ncbi:MAG: hypothetical protein RLZZ184_3943 [Cyanobacteriota bacterium]|jgi:acetyltransferase-like isoleucine patch superfamily enzyme